MSEESAEVPEMIIPAVVGGICVQTEEPQIEYRHPYQDLYEVQVERGIDFHDAALEMIRVAPEDPPQPFSFSIPENPTILHIAKQSNAQFEKMGWKKRLAIVGFADTKKDAPYDDQSWEIWGLNDLHNSIKRWTRWFDIHDEDNINEDVKLGRSPPDRCGIGGLARLKCPVYMQDRNPNVPNSVKYPLQEVRDTFGNLAGGRYFTNSISYMIAFALYEGIISGRQWDEIAIYGVDMAVGTEYVNQRPSCEYWIGVAEGMGIKVYIPAQSDLCHAAFLYGFEKKKQTQFEQRISAGVESIQQRADQIKAAIDQNTAIYNQHLGAIGMAKECMKIMSNLDTKL